MKTLRVSIRDGAGQEVAWVEMSSRRELQQVVPRTGGPQAAELGLPRDAGDLVTLGCLAAAAADAAGLLPVREWSGRWEIESSET